MYAMERYPHLTVSGSEGCSGGASYLDGAQWSQEWLKRNVLLVSRQRHICDRGVACLSGHS